MSRRLALLTALALLTWPHAVYARPAPCADAVSGIRWVPFSTLRSVVGAKMGDPMECGRDDEAGTGDILQTRTTGGARIHMATWVTSFSNFPDRWAITAAGVVHWTYGDASVPPPDAELVYVFGNGWPCEDGWISHADNRQGACSSHGGFARDDLVT